MRQRKTKQMEILLRLLREADRPLTRKELHELALQRMDGIGFATVSRLVSQLLEDRELVRLEYPGQTTRYEMPSVREHPHLLCSQCGRIFDLPSAMPDLKLPSVPGVQISGYEVLYFGTCSNCVEVKATSTDSAMAQ